VTGSRPRDVLNWTQTEQEVAAMSAISLFEWLFETYAEMWAE